jgi:hypothetical protein
MGKYTNEATTAQQIKTATAKSDVLGSLVEFELALCECIASAQPEELDPESRLGQRFESLRICMEQMRHGVLQLQGVVREQWPEIEPMDTMIRRHLQSALEHFEWNKSATAVALGIDRRTVIRMVERFELEPATGAPIADEELPLPPASEETLLRCNDCGAVSEPGETDPRVMHTHTCQHAPKDSAGAAQ